MKFHRLAVPVLAVALGTSGLLVAQDHDHDHDQDNHGAYMQNGEGWDAPPQEFREIQRQGFHDGIEAARKDYDNHRRPDVMNRDEYRHPHIARSARKDYREGFRRGYDVAMQHLQDNDRAGSH